MTLMNAPISVVIPLYNKATTVLRAIDSVLRQTHREFEVIVVDDGSTDNGADVVRSLNNPLIHIRTQSNQGVAAARNHGIAKARYDLIAFLDADDEWKPTFLETMNRLRNTYPQCHVFGARYERKAVHKPSVSAFIREPASSGNEFVFRDYFSVAAMSDPPLHSSAIAVIRDALHAIDGFPVGIAAGEDLLTWARLAARFEIAYTRCVLATFHIDSRQHFLDPPTRRPADDDVVGRELRRLHTIVSPSQRTSLNRYIAVWHKMRANCFLGLRERRSVLKEVFRGLSRWPWDWKLYAYACLATIPIPFWFIEKTRQLMQNQPAKLTVQPKRG